MHSSLGEVYSDAYAYTGVSDSGLALKALDVIEEFQPRTLVVHRDSKEVRASLLDMGVEVNQFIDLAIHRLGEVRFHPLTMWVPFDALDDQRVMEKIWFHLLPGVSFDVARYREFSKFNIQVSERWITEFIDSIKRGTKCQQPG